jgi:hypothetical protein
MLSNILVSPSLTALFITGILLLFIFIFIIANFRSLMKLPKVDLISVLCVFTIAIGSHGLLHLGVEKQYHFNPYTWI